MLAASSMSAAAAQKIGVVNMQEIFQPEFDLRLKMKGEPVSDARPHLPLFEEKLKELLTEVYSMEQPFDQTEELNKCRFCDFKGICGR